MWAHYAQSHEGMLIELEPTAMFAEPQEILIPVEYSPNRPTLNVGISRVDEEFSKKTAPYRVKSPEWSYELEWRAFARLNSSDEHRAIDGDDIHLFRVVPKAIKGIVMGYRMKESDQKRLLKVLRSNPALRHVRVRHAEIDDLKFAMNYLPGPRISP